MPADRIDRFVLVDDAPGVEVLPTAVLGTLGVADGDAPERFREIVEARDLSLSSGGAPAQGLFLSDVRYPAEVFGRRTF